MGGRKDRGGSRDSDVHAHHYETFNSEAQNAGGDPQPISGMPAGNEGGDGESLLSFSHPSFGQSVSFLQLQPATLADPSSISQPVDSLGLAMSQPVHLGTMAATVNQPVDVFSKVASDLAMSRGTLMPCRAAEVQQLPPAGDMQRITQKASNLEYVMNRQGHFVAEDPLQQTSASLFVAAGTSTIASVGLMPAGDEKNRDSMK